MSDVRPATNHVHFFNHATGRPRFHFDDNAPPPSPPPAPAPPPAAAWHDGIEAETLGFWQNKGLDVTDPKKLASELTKWGRNAEKFIGAPPDQIIKLPKADAPPEDLRAFYERLGAPKEAKDYDLSAVKDATIADALRATAHEKGLSKDAASALAATVAKALESRASTDSTLDAAKLAEEKTKLAANWKDKFEFNQLQAMEGARRLGITPEAVKLMEQSIGYSGVMEAMRKIGASTREDTFVERGVGNAGEVTTREGAASRKQELMADRSWADRYLAGGQTEKREMDRLNQMIDG